MISQLCNFTLVIFFFIFFPAGTPFQSILELQQRGCVIVQSIQQHEGENITHCLHRVMAASIKEKARHANAHGLTELHLNASFAAVSVS